MIEQKNKKINIKMILAGVLALALIIGGTLAYLTAETEKKVNDFTFVDSDGDDGDMQVDIDEPNWDPDEGEDLVPGDVVDKDPVAINSSNIDIDEWTAIHVEFKKGTGAALTGPELEWLLTFIDIDWNLGKPSAEGDDMWTKLVSADMSKNPSGYYYYNTLLAQGESSEPLFTKVSYSIDADNDDADKLKNEWKGFQIIVKAHGVQGPHVDYSDLESVWKTVTGTP